MLKDPVVFNVVPYLRLTYEPNARGPDAVDCWGLVRVVYQRELGLTLPAWDTIDSSDPAQCASTVVKEAVGWLEVSLEEARTFDVILLSENGRPIHCGVIISPPQFLHCARGFGTVVASYADRKQIWRRRLVGIFRHPAVAAADRHGPSQALHP